MSEYLNTANTTEHFSLSGSREMVDEERAKILLEEVKIKRIIKFYKIYHLKKYNISNKVCFDH